MIKKQCCTLFVMWLVVLLTACSTPELLSSNTPNDAAVDVDQSSAPNIVIFIADDLGWSDVGYHGSEINTPELDRLAAQGARFDRFYAQAVCSPTRGALMTARSPARTGVLQPFEPWYDEGLPLNEKILPQYFKDEGYDTYAVGKWHLGPNHLSYHPNNRGFDYFYGSLNGFLNHYNHAVWRGVDWQRNGKTVIEEGYSTTLVADDAVRLIQQQDDSTPMLLYVSMHAPHTPLQAPQAAVDEYLHIEDPNRRVFAAMVSEMDRQIARVMAALDEENMINNTLVMFMSDNGGALSLGADNGDYVGGKGSPWEGGILVPALMYWPGKITEGTRYDQIFTVEDILPTFLGAAGASAEYPLPIDGINKWSAISAGAEVVDDESVLVNWSVPGADYSYAYFNEQWKMVQVYEEDKRRRALFNIIDDPFEATDLAAQYPEIVAEYVSRFEAIPKGKVIGLGVPPPPTMTGLGGPFSIEPDFRPMIISPYAESARKDD